MLDASAGALFAFYWQGGVGKISLARATAISIRLPGNGDYRSLNDSPSTRRVHFEQTIGHQILIAAVNGSAGKLEVDLLAAAAVYRECDCRAGTGTCQTIPRSAVYWRTASAPVLMIAAFDLIYRAS